MSCLDFVVKRLIPHIGLKPGTWVTPESPSRPLFSRLRRAATGARKASMAKSVRFSPVIQPAILVVCSIA